MANRTNNMGAAGTRQFPDMQLHPSHVPTVRQMLKDGYSMRDVCERFGIHAHAIRFALEREPKYTTVIR